MHVVKANRCYNLIPLILVYCFVNVVYSVTGGFGSTCLDNNGNPVDWFIVYKLPQIGKSPNKFIKSGVGMAYMDANLQDWKIMAQAIDNSGHAIYNTLQQIYKNKESKDLLYIMYNDETPSHVSSSSGHTKGDLAFDTESGFWLIHSVPKFPPLANESYSYPGNGKKCGQTFLCISFDYSSLDVIGKQLLFNRPEIYEKNFPAAFKSNENIARVMNGEFIKTSPFNNSVILKSQKQQSFTSFAKASKFHLDLYHDWVAPYLKSPLLVETWLNGQGRMASDCSHIPVYNIEELNLTIPFSSAKDHSKWCISKPANDLNSVDGNWVCIGDINRQEKQMDRGGGTVCMQIKSVWNAFNNLVLSKEECKTFDRL